jgi:hypothetical protein
VTGRRGGVAGRVATFAAAALAATVMIGGALGATFGPGLRSASARQQPRHPALLTGADWTRFGSREKQLYLSGFIAGAAAERVRSMAAPRAADSASVDSAAVSSAAIERLRAAKQLPYPYAPSVYSAQLDDFYWWVNHADTPIVDAMITINRQMLTPEHDRGS